MRSSSHHGGSDRGGKAEKSTRVRTVLNEKQLHTLMACYNANPRPDALMKEQLVEMTGLSQRVIRVWFQNHRCKDKKRREAVMQNGVDKHGGKVNYTFIFGITMMDIFLQLRFGIPAHPSLNMRFIPL